MLNFNRLATEDSALSSSPDGFNTAYTRNNVIKYYPSDEKKDEKPNMLLSPKNGEHSKISFNAFRIDDDKDNFLR